MRRFATKKLLTRCISVLRLCPRPLQQRDTTACEQWLVVCNMKETDCEWTTKDDNLVPVMTDLPPAPDELLRVIRCNCTTDCSTARCSCRKHSLECSCALPLHAVSAEVSICSNSTAADISDEDDDDDDDDR